MFLASPQFLFHDARLPLLGFAHLIFQVGEVSVHRLEVPSVNGQHLDIRECLGGSLIGRVTEDRRFAEIVRSFQAADPGRFLALLFVRGRAGGLLAECRITSPTSNG